MSNSNVADEYKAKAVAVYNETGTVSIKAGTLTEDRIVTMPDRSGVVTVDGFGIMTFFNIGANLAANQTAYAAPMAWVVTQATDVYQVPMPACKVTALICACTVNGCTTTTTFTLRKNTTDTAFAATILAGAISGYNDTSTPIEFDRGDLLSVKIVTGATAAMEKLSFTVVYQRLST